MALRQLSLALFLVLTYHRGAVYSSSWWSLGLEGCSISVDDTCRNCAQLESNGILSRSQSDICSESSDTVKPIARGTRQGIITCQNQFKNNSWNCPTFQGDNLFGSFINERVRETASVFALTTAGAISSLARDCHESRLQNCPCVVDFGLSPPDPSDPDAPIILTECDSNYEWASDYFIPFLRSVYDDQESLEAKVDMHNIRVGSKLVSEQSKKCTCHGVSGTCSTQTCYNEVPDVRSIGSQVLTKHSGAVKVGLDDNNNLVRIDNPEADPLQDDDLTFTKNSPDFCEPDTQQGILGTHDRICVQDPSSEARCSLLCCNRGSYQQTKIVPVEECSFVFKPKFDIVCEIVRNDTIVTHRCN